MPFSWSARLDLQKTDYLCLGVLGLASVQGYVLVLVVKKKRESVSHLVCLTLCHPMDCSPPGSSVHGILQKRILEWVAILSPGDLLKPGIKPMAPTLEADSLPSEPPGKSERGVQMALAMSYQCLQCRTSSKNGYHLRVCTRDLLPLWDQAGLVCCCCCC